MLYTLYVRNIIIEVGPFFSCFLEAVMFCYEEIEFFVGYITKQKCLRVEEKTVLSFKIQSVLNPS